MSLRSSSQQPPGIYVKCDRLQPLIEPVTWDLSPARGTARQSWEKLIVIDIRLRYSSLFVHRMHWSLYFLNEYRKWPCLFFFFSAQFDIPYSILFVRVTLSHYSKFKIIVGMSFPCFC